MASRSHALRGNVSMTLCVPAHCNNLFYHGLILTDAERPNCIPTQSVGENQANQKSVNYVTGFLRDADWCMENGNPAPAWKEQAGSVYVLFLPAELPPAEQSGTRP